MNLQTTISVFLEECCQIEPEGDCYADELYLLYKNYIIKQYGMEPIKRLHLVKLLAAAGHYPYYRLRHHRKDNRWGFKGITIKKEKYEKYVLSMEEAPLNQCDDTVAKFIDEIDKKIRPLLNIE